jgi:hypothetical protein
VNVRAAAVSGIVVAVLVLTVAWIFELPLARVAALAPLVVLVAAALAGLVVFWTRAALEGLRGAKHPRVIVGAALAIVILGVLLTVLGIELPRE